MNPKLIIVTLLVVCLLAGCAAMLNKPPKTFMRTYDEPGIWKSIEVREGLSKDELWRTVVDAISQQFDLEVLEKESGYLRTSWKYTFLVGKQISEKYRTRIIIKFVGEEWKTVQIKSESNWLEKEGWILGYDTMLLEDVFGDIQGRIGRVRR